MYGIEIFLLDCPPPVRSGGRRNIPLGLSVIRQKISIECAKNIHADKLLTGQAKSTSVKNKIF
jgi:hypothetical protein